jgi:hypothetical protein
MNLRFHKAWPEFAKSPLDARQADRVQEWLDCRPSGKDMILDTASLGGHQKADFDGSRLDSTKPTALLAANVIWDLTALNKQVIFHDMIEWVAETILWFAVHPELQLIVKPHPAELNPSIPATEERVATGLAERGVALPDNVFLLSPDASLTVYQLIPLCDVGIVHTSTVGLEMAAMGKTVVTTAASPYRGFGFTLDPETREEYFSCLEHGLTGRHRLDQATQVDLAKKFILFYQFHYYTRTDIMDYKLGKMPDLLIQSIEELLPGRNACRDYIIDSVMAGLPIVSENRWPPES